MKLFLSICILFLSKSGTAGTDIVHCRDHNNLLPSITLSEQVEHISWPIKTSDIKDAPCTDKTALNNDEIEKLYSQPTPYDVKKNIFGLDLEDSDSNLELLYKLLAIEEVGSKESIFDQQSNFKISKDCKKVLCAVKEIFGLKSGPKILYTLDQYGINLSNVRVKDAILWKEEQIDGFIDTINDLPDFIVNSHTNHRCIQSSKSHKTALANAKMTIFRNIDKLSSAHKQMVYMHELGHTYADILEIDDHEEWLKIGKWEKDSSAPKLIEAWNSDGNHVSSYATTNPKEDLAESFVTYRYAPHRLKSTAPKKYEFIKKYIFQGLEYTSEDKCKEVNSTSYRYLKKTELKKDLEYYPECKDYVIGLLSQDYHINELKKCLKINYANQTVINNYFDQNFKQIKNPRFSTERMKEFSNTTIGLYGLDDLERKSLALFNSEKSLPDVILNELRQANLKFVNNIISTIKKAPLKFTKDCGDMPAENRAIKSSIDEKFNSVKPNSGTNRSDNNKIDKFLIRLCNRQEKKEQKHFRCDKESLEFFYSLFPPLLLKEKDKNISMSYDVDNCKINYN